MNRLTSWQDIGVLIGEPFALMRRVAFLYHADFGMRPLPRPPDTFFGTCEAHAINERNTQTGRVQLAGYCQTGGGARHAVRWDVTVSIVSTAPPSTTP